MWTSFAHEIMDGRYVVQISAAIRFIVQMRLRQSNRELVSTFMWFATVRQRSLTLGGLSYFTTSLLKT